jgi:hypothetical protein
MQKKFGFFAVGKVMLCVGGGLGAAGTIGGRGGPLIRGGLCDGEPQKGEDYNLHQDKRPLEGTDYAPDNPLTLYRTEVIKQ